MDVGDVPAGRPAVKTVQMNATEMEERIGRFSELEPLMVLQDEDVPLGAKDLVYARKVMPIVSPKGMVGPLVGNAPIQEGDFTLICTVCPPGQGPGLHAHHRTTETFTCLDGRFKVYWGDEGEHETVLERYDTVSVPPGVCRGFTNVGESEGILQVLITGGIHNMDDIAFRPAMADALAAFGPEVLETFEGVGFTFNAGVV